MVSIYFGLPGSGKTTMYAKKAYDAAYKKRSPYKHIYGNVSLTGIKNYVKIDVADLGKYDLHDALILIDEGILYFDSRAYASFSKNFSEFFLLHRHYNVDVCIFSQSGDSGGVDKRIRNICDRCFYIFKGPLTGWYKSRVWRIPYGIAFSDKKDNGKEGYGDIISGYYKPSPIQRLLTPNLKRAKYYPYFDSWERKPLPPLPTQRIDEQERHNKFSYDNLCKMLKDTPKRRYFKRKRLTKLIKEVEKTLDIT